MKKWLSRTLKSKNIPLRIRRLVVSATLDSMTNQCSEIVTDGEGTQKQISISRRIHSIVALLRSCYQGRVQKQSFWMATICLWLKNLKTDSTTSFGFSGYLVWFVVQGR